MSSNAIFLRKHGRAIAMLKTQLSKPESFNPRLGVAQGNLADLERHAGQMDAASHTYEQARVSLGATLREQPDNAHLISGLAWIEACLGNQSKALDLGRRAISLSPAPKHAYSGPAYDHTLA